MRIESLPISRRLHVDTMSNLNRVRERVSHASRRCTKNTSYKLISRRIGIESMSTLCPIPIETVYGTYRFGAETAGNPCRSYFESSSKICQICAESMPTSRIVESASNIFEICVDFAWYPYQICVERVSCHNSAECMQIQCESMSNPCRLCEKSL